ncbi:Os01g0543600 [Oryza sativa Japonica Group]|jgi:hypothetical protein|uniref:Os01g0543600 protein n=1 Tax=Oryza sativa subsp. japonica TaxID=39947 RepID=A0A0P0V3S5_ORYSJ|nr:hypothetical protein EE612_003301 [Oryza sativa]BAS72581.1 Os01g0543600 [Oryza sativa Japonica Group]
MAKVHELSTKGMAVDMTELFSTFSNDLICRLVSGKNFQGEGRNKLFRQLFKANSVLLAGFNLKDYYPGLARLKAVSMVMCAKARNTRKLWDELLDEIIDERMSKQQCEHDEGNDQDEMNFVNVLLLQEQGITREHLKAILVVSKVVFSFFVSDLFTSHKCDIYLSKLIYRTCIKPARRRHQWS